MDPLPRLVVRPDKFTAGPESDWPSWRLTFSRAVTINQLTDPQARCLLQALMSGDAVLRTSDVTVEDCTLEEALTRYENHFVTSSDSTLARCEFDLLTQEQAETVVAFHSRVRAAFMRAYPGRAQDQQLIRQFIMGLRDTEVL